VSIEIPLKDLTSELVYQLWWLVACTAILLLSSLAVAWAIGSRIASAIHKLAAPALALGSGEAVTVPLLRLKEADEVGRALTRASAMLMAAQHRANHDALTGLANRALFDEIFSHQLAICRRTSRYLAILYIDLDGFKPVNDRHGHAAGDVVLKVVAATLVRNVRASDTVARLGGDEFAVILWNLSEADAAAKALALEQAVAQAAVAWEAETLCVGASIGLSMLGPDDEFADALAKADRAMYARKAQRKGNILPPPR
jgi:diguanylate cyclase (GGDEF)-like protein